MRVSFLAWCRLVSWHDAHSSFLHISPPQSHRFIEEDTLAYMNGWVKDVEDGEWESYAIPLTQADSSNIPSSSTFGSCDSASSFKVAIIDSGVQIKHEDFHCVNGKHGSNCVGRSFGTDDDWWNPYEAWHGTHVMGIMAAKGGNSQGTTGVIPTWNNVCWIVGRVFSDANSADGAYLSNVYKAVAWAVGKGAKVVNMSLSGGYTETGQKVMKLAKDNGAIVVAGAGNSNTFQYEYPSSYENDDVNVLSVGAVDSERYVYGVVSTVVLQGRENSIIQSQFISHTYSLYFFLQYISIWAPFSTCNRNLDISAPGVSIWGLDTQPREARGAYRIASGTSMAAAHVSGIIAKIWSQCPDCSDGQVSSCIKSSATDLGDYPWCFGAGLVQAKDAYKCLKKECC
jgi:hypothetical protein